MRVRRNISAELGRSFIGSLAFMRKTPIGLLLAALILAFLGERDDVMPVHADVDLRVTQRRHRRRELPLAAVDDKSRARPNLFSSRPPSLRPPCLGRLAARKRRDSTSYIDAKSSLVARWTLKVRYALGRSPSRNTTIDATVAVPWMCEMSKHSMRRGSRFRLSRCCSFSIAPRRRASCRAA